jgi:hypothetical protein
MVIFYFSFVARIFDPKSIIWSVAFLLVGLFIVMNFRAMKYFLTAIEVHTGNLKLTYLDYDEPKEVSIPLKEVRADYFENGKGLSTLVSHHISIRRKDKIILRQFEAPGWTLNVMRDIIEELYEFRK